MLKNLSKKPFIPHLTGHLGEFLAKSFLRKQGYWIWFQNWRDKNGELDIVASYRDTLVFIEVKTRRHELQPLYRPEEAVYIEQKERIHKAAQGFSRRYHYLLKRRRIKQVRFDIIGVMFKSKHPLLLRHELIHLVDVF